MWVYRKSLGLNAVVDPHLAKNERDVGHPSFVATGCSLGPERSAVEKCSSDFQERYGPRVRRNTADLSTPLRSGRDDKGERGVFPEHSLMGSRQCQALPCFVPPRVGNASGDFAESRIRSATKGGEVGKSGSTLSKT
jgi:hypothetical protein